MPDLYMPVLAALYWHARAVRKCNAPQALQLARSQLRSGDWPHAVVRPLHEAYRTQMLQVLQRIARLVPDSDEHREQALEGEPLQHTLALARRTVFSWCVLPSERRLLGIDALPDEPSLEQLLPILRQWCRGPQQREELVAAVLERLIDARHHPGPDVRAGFEYVAAFTMCWGDGGEAAAAQA